MMIKAMTAGKRENRFHTMLSTESVMEAGSTLALPMESVTMLAPASPQNNATREPLMAVPNF